MIVGCGRVLVGRRARVPRDDLTEREREVWRDGRRSIEPGSRRCRGAKRPSKPTRQHLLEAELRPILRSSSGVACSPITGSFKQNVAGQGFGRRGPLDFRPIPARRGRGLDRSSSCLWVSGMSCVPSMGGRRPDLTRQRRVDHRQRAHFVVPNRCPRLAAYRFDDSNESWRWRWSTPVRAPLAKEVAMTVRPAAVRGICRPVDHLKRPTPRSGGQSALSGAAGDSRRPVAARRACVRSG